MTAATNAQRQAALKARRKAAGLVPVTVWVHPDWRECLKNAARGFTRPIETEEKLQNERIGS